MSDFTDAFTELFDAQTESTGASQTVTVGGVSVSAVVSEMTFDMIISYGGKAESGGYTIMALKSAFTTAPAKLATVTITKNGVTTALSLQTLVENNGIYHMTIFDPVAEE